MTSKFKRDLEAAEAKIREDKRVEEAWANVAKAEQEDKREEDIEYAAASNAVKEELRNRFTHINGYDSLSSLWMDIAALATKLCDLHSIGIPRLASSAVGTLVDVIPGGTQVKGALSRYWPSQQFKYQLERLKPDPKAAMSVLTQWVELNPDNTYPEKPLSTSSGLAINSDLEYQFNLHVNAWLDEQGYEPATVKQVTLGSGESVNVPNSFKQKMTNKPLDAATFITLRDDSANGLNDYLNKSLGMQVTQSAKPAM